MQKGGTRPGPAFFSEQTLYRTPLKNTATSGRLKTRNLVRGETLPNSMGDHADNAGLSGPSALQHSTFDCFFCGLTTPHNELKYWIESFAFIQRSFNDDGDMVFADHTDQGIIREARMPEQQGALVAPILKVPDPHPLIHKPQKLVNLAAPSVWYLQVKQTGKLQGLEVVPPEDTELQICIASAHKERELILIVAFTRPIVGPCQFFRHVDGMNINDVCMSGGEIGHLKIPQSGVGSCRTSRDRRIKLRRLEKTRFAQSHEIWLLRSR